MAAHAKSINMTKHEEEKFNETASVGSNNLVAIATAATSNAASSHPIKLSEVDAIRNDTNKSESPDLLDPSFYDGPDNDGPEITRSGPRTKVKKGKAQKPKDVDNFNYRVGLDEDLPPLSKINDIFSDITDKALKLGLDSVVKQLNGRRLVIGTMCSGTESPVLALQMVSEILQNRGYNFDFHHSFSAELVPYKQAYIERNFRPPIVFRDVKEFSGGTATEGTTAYGGKVEIPGKIDILVAGFACVDFSSLNGMKKSIEEGGESNDTFEGIRGYAAKFRPPIIILENVLSAPWGPLGTRWRAIGYTAQFVRVDTKHYYIPHTRVRGYMLCVDDAAFHDQAKKHSYAPRVVMEWTGLMENFKRQASCSVEEFLLDVSDPRFIRGIEELEAKGDRFQRKIAWESSKARHRDYRSDFDLGQDRPLTRWQDGGLSQGTDHMRQGWIRRQVERVWDSIDISYLRSLRRGFDFEYKFRFLDLSQNIDRNVDCMAAGIANCVTPSGIPYHSLRGGPVIGLEALALQGLPIDRLQLTREKQSELQDLAGNAMSSTVVGSAILSALIAGVFCLRPSGQNPINARLPATLTSIVGESHLEQFSLDLGRYEPLSVLEALEQGANSARLCLCEGQEIISEHAIQKCVLCKHTTCVKCGGNPEHEYAPLSKDICMRRNQPESFINLIKKAIPMRVQLTGIYEDEILEITNQYEERIDISSWELSISHIHKALKSELRFQSTKRSDFWTIFYQAEHAKMELVIKSDHVEWRLYALPPPTAAVNSRIRQLLAKPIARMRPMDDDLTQGLWQLWLPKQQEFCVEITGSGGLTPSFESKHGVGKFKDDLVQTEYEISIGDPVQIAVPASIVGTYKLLQDCGKALGSLHVQKETADLGKTFFFLDPHRLHLPSKDSFIFSLENRRLEFWEKREVIATLDPSWRPPIFQMIQTSGGNNHQSYKLKDTEKPLPTLENHQLTERVKCFVDGEWIDLPKTQLRSSGGRHDLFRSVGPDFVISNSVSCRNTHAIFSCETFIPDDERSDWKQSKWVEISRIEQREFFTSFAWITDKACLLRGLDEWRSVVPSLEICATCAPNPPRIKWRVESPKVSGNVANPKRGKVNLKLVPFEDPAEAAVYELQLKSRPESLVTQVYINDNGLLNIQIAFNPVTLMHRAAAKLSPRESVAEISWRLITDHDPSVRFNSPQFKIPDNTGNPSATTPVEFAIDLRPNQLRSLWWMLHQESDDCETFVEEEVEEVVIPELRWRGEGRATNLVTVKGGLLADQVGYGKTAVTLALIESQRKRDELLATNSTKGRISLKATLILVPGHLTNQWLGEVKKFLSKGKHRNVVVLKNIRTLQRTTIDEFQKADIIIAAWSLLEGKAYLSKIAHFSGMVELPDSASSRAISAWYDQVLKEIFEHVEILKGGGETLKDLLEQKLRDNEVEASKAETFVPSKRFRGRAYQAHKEEAGNKLKRKHEMIGSDCIVEVREPRTDCFGLGEIAQGSKNWTSMQGPPMEIFEFARVVIDEYAYVTGQKVLTVLGLKAHCRWILSATPPLEDFADVKCVAKYLGINLGVDDATPFVIRATNVSALERDATDTELFHSYKSKPSIAWHENRVRVAQRFLDQFARRNPMDSEAFAASNHLVPVTLPPTERALYLELNQFLISNGFDTERFNGRADNDRSRRILQLFEQSPSASEALVRRATQFTFGYLDEKLDCFQLCEAMVILRFMEHEQTLNKIAETVKLAEWLRSQCTDFPAQYASWKRQVQKNDFGEIDAMFEIDTITMAAESACTDDDWMEFYLSPEQMAQKMEHHDFDQDEMKPKRARRTIESYKFKRGDNNSALDSRPEKPVGTEKGKSFTRASLALREVIKQLHLLTDELVSQSRCLRFSICVRNIQELDMDLGIDTAREPYICDICHDTTVSSKMIWVLTECGHRVCNGCKEDSVDKAGHCPVTGCGAVNRDYQAIKTEDFIGKDRFRDFFNRGQKIEDIVDLIQKIPGKDQILIFVQFPDIGKKLMEAFEEEDIHYESLGGRGDPSERLTAFQTNTNTGTRAQVLILNMGDESAAGSNLTNANHIIFVSPYLASSQQRYDHAMTQAIGRARRYGQEKHIHIYHFVSLKTIDVDILQMRTKKMLEKVLDADADSETLLERPFRGFVPAGFELTEPENDSEDKCGEFGSSYALENLENVEES